MTAITFPNSPSSGDTHTAGNGIVYTYDGEKWTSIGTNSAGTWTRSGTEVSLTNAGDDLNVDSGTLFVDASTDRVGVGTSSPSYSFHLYTGSGTAYQTTAWFQGKGSHSTSTFDRAVALGASNSGAHIDAWNGTAGSRGGTALLLQSAGGNVGIGTTSPGKKLQVDSADFDTALFKRTNSTGSATIFLSNTSDHGAALQSLGNGAGGFALFTQTSGTITERMRIDSSGNVGIGTTSPAEMFHVKGGNARIEGAPSTDAILQIRGDNSTASATDAVLSFVSYLGNASYGSNGEIRVTNQGSGVGQLVFGNRRSSAGGIEEAARIDGSGRLLVGTSSSPSYASADNFVVADAGNSGITIRSSTTGFGTIAFSDATSGTGEYDGYLQYNQLSRYLAIATASTERMRITPTGFSKHKGNGAGYYNAGGNYHEFTTDIASFVLVLQNVHASVPYGIFIKYTSTPNNTASPFLEFEDNAALRFKVVSNGGIYNYSGNNSNLSDEREKKNIEPLDSTWGCLKNWELKKFHYNEDADTDDKRYGVIAQQVAPHCPEVITDWIKQSAKDAELDDDGNVVTPAQEEIARLGVKEEQMMWMAIKALQEAQTRIETLEAKVAALEAS